MSNPWDIKSDDSRIEDFRSNFIIFCEDSVCEYHYFKYFKTSQIDINIIGNQKSKIINVEKAIEYCKENGLMEDDHLDKDDTLVWCVFDRDIEESKRRNQFENDFFNDSIEIANTKGLRVAWSNDAFELWILLHFEDIDVNDETFRHRNAYYDRLTETFKSISNPNTYLEKVQKHASFSYTNDLKNATRFVNIVRPEIVGKISIAIERAKRIEAHFANKNIPNHEKAPCTMVHHLVEELIRLGGKEI
jgi:hypothetical protein